MSFIPVLSIGASMRAPTERMKVSRSGVIFSGFLTVFLFLSGSLGAKEQTTYNLGPTGLLGTVSKTAINVTEVAKGSPADGKIKAGDQIISAGAENFKNDPRRELAEAIDLAETKEAGGKLTLILKGDKKADLQLKVLGSYSSTAPYNCPKSDAIIKMAAEALVKSGKAGHGACKTGLLGLMATGEKKYIDEVANILKSTDKDSDWRAPSQEDMELLLKGDKDMGYVTWNWGYKVIMLSEYYLLTKDAAVLPDIKRYAVTMARGQDAGGLYGHRLATVKRNGRLPGYAQMNQPSLTCFMALLMAQKCGINDPNLEKGIARTYAYYNSFVGRGAFPYGVHGPNTAAYNNNGTSGSAAMCMALKGNKEGVKFFSQLASTSYEGLETGHASTFFNPLWTPLGANLSGPEVTQQFFNKSRWLQTMYRSWDGSFSRFDGNSKEGPQAGTALLTYCLPRKALYITGRGADESVWLKGKDAIAAVGMSTADYDSMGTEVLMDIAMNHSIPQVRRAASAALGDRRDELAGTYIKYLRGGTAKQKELAIGQYGWWIPMEVKQPYLADIAAVMSNPKEDSEVRVAAAGSLAYFGKPAYKYYMDMVKLTAEERPDDIFGDVDWTLGKCLTSLCKEPFKAGLVTDKDLFYKVVKKLCANKRQHVRAYGVQLLAGMPSEDFHIVADTVMHLARNEDPTYHSYHSPGGYVSGAISVLADAKVKEGIPLALGMLDDPSGKWSFKVRAIADALSAYGPSAKPALEKLRADTRFKNIESNPKLAKSWNAMVKAIEDGQMEEKLISFKEAKKASLDQ